MINKQDVYALIDAERDNMLQLWEELVNVDCGSANKAGVNTIADKLKPIFEKLGFSVRLEEFDKAGSTVIASKGDTSKPFIVLLGHMDTVFKDGTVAKRPFTIKDGKAYGPGCLDMKGGIVLMLAALKVLFNKGYNKYPLKVILAGDEECAHIDSTADETIMREAQGAFAAFNFETGFLDEAVVTQRKGRLEFAMEAFGRSAHVGNDPENGRSAIKELAYKILDIENLTDWDKGVNLNVGTIEGGVVSNAVPAYAKIVCDMRYTDYAVVPEMKAKLQAIADKQYIEDTKTTLTICTEFREMKLLPNTEALLKIVQDAACELGLPCPSAKMVGGASDSAYTTAVGVPTICALGVQGARNHTAEEFAVVDTMFSRCKLFATILLNI